MNGERGARLFVLDSGSAPGMTAKTEMNGNGVVFWLEGTDVKHGALIAWKWLPCEMAAAEVITPWGQRLDILAEDIFLSRGAAMKELASLAGV